MLYTSKYIYNWLGPLGFHLAPLNTCISSGYGPVKYNSYLSICTRIFYFSFVPIDLPTVSVCTHTVFCTYSTSIKMHIRTSKYNLFCTYSYGYEIREPYIQ